MRVGCQAATNQGKGWKHIGVAPGGGKPWPPELQLQVEWLLGSWRQREDGPSLRRAWRGQSCHRQKALGQGRLEPVPLKTGAEGQVKLRDQWQIWDERAGRVCGGRRGKAGGPEAELRV